MQRIEATAIPELEYGVITHTTRERMVDTLSRHRVVVYATTLAVALVATLAYLAVTVSSTGNPAVIAGLAFVAILSERKRIKFSSSFEQSISLLPAIFAAVLFGPLAAAIVGALSLAG